jgi:hypothetical protein
MKNPKKEESKAEESKDEDKKEEDKNEEEDLALTDADVEKIKEASEKVWEV